MSTTQHGTRPAENGRASAGGAEPLARIEEAFGHKLEAWIGKTVTIVNPESFEDAPVGRQLKAGFYRAKLTGLGDDYLVLATQYVRTGPHPGKEPVRQFIPLAMVKRISALQSERVIHL